MSVAYTLTGVRGNDDDAKHFLPMSEIQTKCRWSSMIYIERLVHTLNSYISDILDAYNS